MGQLLPVPWCRCQGNHKQWPRLKEQLIPISPIMRDETSTANVFIVIYLRLVGTKPFRWNTYDPLAKVWHHCSEQVLCFICWQEGCGGWGCHVCFITALPSVSLWDLRDFSSPQSSLAKLANQTKTYLLYGKWLSGYLPITMQLAVWATFRVTGIFTGGNMSREGRIDRLGYLGMALSPVQRPLNASFSFLYSSLLSI